MHSRYSRLAFPILALTAFLPGRARADVPYATNRFSITFSDGWQAESSLVGNDSALSLAYGYSMMGFCHLAASDPDHPATPQAIEGYLKPYTGGGSAAKTGEGTATLGGRDFTYTEYKGAGPYAGDIRARIYASSLGRWRFEAILIYDSASSQDLVADLESALSTLDYPAVAVRALPIGPRSPEPAANLDVLGRLRAAPVRTALFRAPRSL